MKTYKINNRIYKEHDAIELTFKIGLQNLQTFKTLWSNLYEGFVINSKEVEIFNGHKAKNVKVSGTVANLVEILYTLGHNSYIFQEPYGFTSGNIVVLQSKFRPKYVFSRTNGDLPKYQVYKPGEGWRFVTNTPVKCEKQVVSHGKIYRNYNHNFLNQYQISRLNNRF